MINKSPTAALLQPPEVLEKLAPKIVRTEAHALRTTPMVRADIKCTLVAYRRAVRALCGVIQTHWPELGSLSAKGKCQAIEALFHPTAKRPVVRYLALERIFGKMPSYLRRAAIEAAYGVVRSFLSNYDNWLAGDIGGKPRELGSRTPRMGFSNVFPPLYGGNMLLVGVRELPKSLRAKDQPGFIGPQRKPASANQLAARAAKADEFATPYGSVRVKLLGPQGEWAFSAPLRLCGKPKRLGDLSAMALSPTLMQRGAKAWLSCPVESRPPKYVSNDALTHRTTPFRVCAVDVGINTAATSAIVDATGTVIARKFTTCARHNDQRDKLGSAIALRHAQSCGSSGKLTPGQSFCASLYRRIEGLNLDAARTMAREIVQFAQSRQAELIVVENLKGWKPKGGSRKQRPRFHRFQHRMLIQCIHLKAQELGMRVLEVYARGTSRWAYDGSGQVRRSNTNAQMATFASGKQYNADLNGALNIAARGLAMVLGINAGTGGVVNTSPQTENCAQTGKRSGCAVRMPLVLADIWTYTQAASGALADSDVSGGCFNRPPKAVGTLERACA